MKYYKVTFAEIRLTAPFFPIYIAADTEYDLAHAIEDIIKQGRNFELAYEADVVTKTEWENEE